VRRNGYYLEIYGAVLLSLRPAGSRPQAQPSLISPPADFCGTAQLPAAERAPPPPPSDDDDDRVAAVRPGSPAVDRWDSDEEADDDEAGAPCAVQRVQPAQPTQPVEYAEPSGVVVAPGIVADDNFADDDWDDDE